MLINITPGTAVGQPVKDYAILPSSSSNTVNDFATSGTDLAQRLSKLSDEINGIVRDVKEGKGTVGDCSPMKRFTTISTRRFVRLRM